MKVAVVDGQGGGMGRLIVEKLRQELGNTVTIIGLGTNALATSVMLRAGANEGASGENAVVYSSSRVDLIVGSISIIAADSFLGELTPRMAEAIASSSALKILLPLNRYNIELVGVIDEPLPAQVDQLVSLVRRRCTEKD
jgi:NAD(P)-dependent dehydrogenase (short-subunit alcohol dehydrogenase family)